MAKFDFDVSQADENIYARLSAAHDVANNPEFDAVLERAAGRLAGLLREKLERLGLRKSGQLIDSVRPTKVKVAKGQKHIDVYPQGYRDKEGGRRNAHRNAMVGYAHEYGVMRGPPLKPTAARHWMGGTVDEAYDEVSKIMRDGLDEILKNNLGG